ncbi:hypothetical protein IU459_23230 [Nocardia amamiensis]|uniref:Uncharacterized protein n=1 Tax=Nocardia amamiensis TaxID=404578 RepID=A0ABS0CV92_9NOCA|nr:hypothetical protein [Nocardia amamiensis]MBF6300435.1 hypothetical protein [Nocardia amamiensis]
MDLTDLISLLVCAVREIDRVDNLQIGIHLDIRLGTTQPQIRVFPDIPDMPSRQVGTELSRLKDAIRAADPNKPDRDWASEVLGETVESVETTVEGQASRLGAHVGAARLIIEVNDKPNV